MRAGSSDVGSRTFLASATFIVESFSSPGEDLRCLRSAASLGVFGSSRKSHSSQMGVIQNAEREKMTILKSVSMIMMGSSVPQYSSQPMTINCVSAPGHTPCRIASKRSTDRLPQIKIRTPPICMLGVSVTSIIEGRHSLEDSSLHQARDTLNADEF